MWDYSLTLSSFLPDRHTVSHSEFVRVDSSGALSRQQLQSEGDCALYYHGSRPGCATPRPTRGTETISILAAAAQLGRGRSCQQAGGAPCQWRFPQDGQDWKFHWYRRGLGWIKVLLGKFCIWKSEVKMSAVSRKLATVCKDVNQVNGQSHISLRTITKWLSFPNINMTSARNSLPKF